MGVLGLCALCGAPGLGAQGPGESASPRSFVRGPVFVALQVTELDGMRAWYERVFDLELVNRIDAEDGRYAIRILSAPGFTVELIRMRDVGPASERQAGLFKAGVFVEHIDRFRDALVARGVATDATVFVDPTLQVRSFVFRDPVGNRLQAFEPCDGTCPS